MIAAAATLDHKAIAAIVGLIVLRLIALLQLSRLIP